MTGQPEPVARRMKRLIDPIHLVAYQAHEPTAALEALGLRGFGREVARKADVGANGRSLDRVGVSSRTARRLAEAQDQQEVAGGSWRRAAPSPETPRVMSARTAGLASDDP